MTAMDFPILRLCDRYKLLSFLQSKLKYLTERDALLIKSENVFSLDKLIKNCICELYLKKFCFYIFYLLFYNRLCTLCNVPNNLKERYIFLLDSHITLYHAEKQNTVICNSRTLYLFMISI